MTKKTRIILFLFLVVLFILTAPIVVFYSLGWRIDWGTKRIAQPGIFYFKVWPSNVQIYLNGSLKKRTDFFFGSVLIENLLPKKYDVEIKKEGFHSWKKTLEIKKREVTEAKNIILIPQKPDFKILYKEIEELFFSSDGKKIILKEKTKNTAQASNEDWVLKLYELENNLKSHLIEKNDISPARNASSIAGAGGEKEAEIIDLKLAPDSKKILMEIKLEKISNYYVLEIDKEPPLLIPLDFLKPAIEKIDFNPGDPQKLIILKENKLSEIDLINEKVSSPVLENIISYSIFKDNFYYLDNSGNIFKTDFSFGRRERLNKEPFPLKQETNYQIAVSPFDIVLKEGDALFIFNKGEKIFEKISQSVKDFKFSPDFKKLVYFNNYEIWLLFLDKKYDQPQKEAGDKIFLTRFSEKIGKLFWYTNYYLIFDVNKQIKIAEIDDRDKINIVDLAVNLPLHQSTEDEADNEGIFWNQINKKLYILSNKNLYVSEKLAP